MYGACVGCIATRSLTVCDLNLPDKDISSNDSPFVIKDFITEREKERERERKKENTGR